MPLLLQRLHTLRNEKQNEAEQPGDEFLRPFAGIGNDTSPQVIERPEAQTCTDEKRKLEAEEGSSPAAKKARLDDSTDKENTSPAARPRMVLSSSKFGPAIPQKEISGGLCVGWSDGFRSCQHHCANARFSHNSKLVTPEHDVLCLRSVGDCSNSSWADLEPFIIGHFRMHPLNADMKQRLIVKYLTPMAEYQDVSGTRVARARTHTHTNAHIAHTSCAICVLGGGEERKQLTHNAHGSLKTRLFCEQTRVLACVFKSRYAVESSLLVESGSCQEGNVISLFVSVAFKRDGVCVRFSFSRTCSSTARWSSSSLTSI